jgi:hypothetical protein
MRGSPRSVRGVDDGPEGRRAHHLRVRGEANDGPVGEPGVSARRRRGPGKPPIAPVVGDAEIGTTPRPGAGPHPPACARRRRRRSRPSIRGLAGLRLQGRLEPARLGRRIVTTSNVRTATNRQMATVMADPPTMSRTGTDGGGIGALPNEFIRSRGRRKIRLMESFGRSKKKPGSPRGSRAQPGRTTLARDSLAYGQSELTASSSQPSATEVINAGPVPKSPRMTEDSP